MCLRRSSVVLLCTLLLGASESRAEVKTLSPTRIVELGAGLDDLVSDGRGLRTLLSQYSPNGPKVSAARVGASGLKVETPVLALSADADLHGGRLLPGDGGFAAYNTRGDGSVGNELRVVVDSAGTRYEQRLNSASTQASALFDSIAVGPTGTLAVPFIETVLPYGTEKFNSYAVAVRPPGAAAFSEPQPLFPRGAQGVDVLRARTFLGPDGGGWVFLLPNGDDWLAGEPVVVLARRIDPDGRLGVLLHLRVPITRPVNTNVEIAAKFTDDGRLVAAFSSSGYVREEEHAVVWTHTFTASTRVAPPRAMIVDRKGGYSEYDNIDLQLDADGRPAVIAQTRGGLRVFRQRAAGWAPGPRVTTTRHTSSARLVLLPDGRSAAIWLQPFDRPGERSRLMVAHGAVTDRRWPTRRVPGLMRPGPQRLDAVAACGDRGVAAAIYTHGVRLVLLTIPR